MRVEGERSFEAPRDTVWAVLNDPASMAKTMPGVTSFDVQDDRHWTANVKIPLGLGGLRMKIHMDKVEERAPDYAKLHAKGEGVGAILNMETEFELAEAGSGTTMKWAADVKIAGPVGSMGQRVLQPIVNQQVGHVLKSLEKEVESARNAPPGQGAASGASPGTGAASGAGVDIGTGETAAVETGEGGAGETDTAGTGGAEAGIHEVSPEAYSAEPEGPTTSTED